MCRGGVALPRLTFDFFVGDRSPSSMPPSKLKPSTPSGEMKLGEARFVGVDGSAPKAKGRCALKMRDRPLVEPGPGYEAWGDQWK